ncbi:uncharacterized protein PHALS_05038 [Plasmopara halstedii]|uniref:Uncharacterized protein n=1 Tax=Plasmopara halstedii TaxID=4781 RepID=A0A0P1AA32_PLAHL|nr:uncharacterized protein PHALS_05038 [Plasmopara halstedii]CEG37445.1 hypothetical protein PHALS_05038 [Plasmopara halstedii]|eukprot:XP_024573814.1 hypothetical protein PHALS_05038 [Plasmopara halstedii]
MTLAENLRKNIKLVHMVKFRKNNHNLADFQFGAKFEPLLKVKRRVEVNDESKCADANLSVQRCERIVNPTFDSGTTSTSTMVGSGIISDLLSTNLRIFPGCRNL